MLRPTLSRLNKGRVELLLALVLAVALPAQAKRLEMQMPAYDKLVEGAGPETNDVKARQTKTALAPRLAPLRLGDAAEAAEPVEEPGSHNGYLKSSVSVTGFAPKGPIDPASKSLFAPKENLTDHLGQGGLVKQARNVNAMPLPLLESPEETQKKLETVADAEKAQLSDLWESTLTRSPDIQFVVQKLMPTSNPGHASTVMMRFLSNAIFGAMGALSMASPSPWTYGATNMGASMMMNLLQAQEGKQAQKARISQTETIMLYNMVRGTADKLVENYRNYKKTMTVLAKSLADLQDLQNMVAEARAGQDAAKQVEMEYTIRRAQRDVEAVSEDVKRFRQGLVDLAGTDAVAKLDKQLDEEQARIEQASPGSSPGNTKTATAPGTQS